MKLAAYSKALYSNWIYLESLRLLLDVGEGINNLLEYRLMGVRVLCLSHGHTDHFTGLHSMIGMRMRESFLHDQEYEPLQIYYPCQSPSLDRYLDYLRQSIPEWDALVDLHPLRAGESFRLDDHDDMVVTPFAMEHVPGELCFGYRIAQRRHKLKEELHGKSDHELAQIAQEQGRDAMHRSVDVPLISYSGDGRPLQDPDSHGVELLIHEATFLDPDGSEAHSQLSEALGVFRSLEAKRLLLCHLSARYTHDEILQALDAQVPDPDERARVDVILPGELKEFSLMMPGL